MTSLTTLQQKLNELFASQILASELAYEELTLEIAPADILEIAPILRDNPSLQFDTLIDVCGVDYLEYGYSEWATESTTTTGFSRGVREGDQEFRCITFQKPRFAVVYHFLSTVHNQRLRVKAFLEEELKIQSVAPIWAAANWFEREAFDLFGILFEGHPDLRRILTDYGFIGYPFRKDFPLIGQVEMRYDAQARRVVYEPVSIKPRVLVPKVIRDNNRHANKGTGEDNAGNS